MPQTAEKVIFGNFTKKGVLNDEGKYCYRQL